MTKPQVICYVNTCTHYVAGNLCGARNIDIMQEREGQTATVVEQTMCKSFHENTGLTSYLGSLDNVNWSGAAAEFMLPGHQMDPTISCSVASCAYWAEGRRCTAIAIEVTGSHANECEDTDCKTFVRRNEEL